MIIEHTTQIANRVAQRLITATTFAPDRPKQFIPRNKGARVAGETEQDFDCLGRQVLWGTDAGDSSCHRLDEIPPEMKTA